MRRLWHDSVGLFVGLAVGCRVCSMKENLQKRTYDRKKNAYDGKLERPNNFQTYYTVSFQYLNVYNWEWV